jgi:SSS family solute:Na+ symporter
VKTDVLQIILTLAGLGLLLFITFAQQPDWSLLPPEHLSFPFSFNYPPVNIISLVLIAGLPHVVGSDIFGKVLCARDGDVAKRSSALAGILKILAGILVGIIGLNAALLLPASTLPDSVLSELLITYTDPLLATIIVIALLSTLMSSADSVLLTAATVVSRDLLGGDRLPTALHGRIMTVIVGLVGVMLTLQFPTILSAFLFAYTLFSASIVVPVLFGFWKEPLKLTRTGAVVSMLISAVLIIVLSILGTDSATITIAGIIVNAVLLFGVSWLSNLFRSTGS